MMIAQITQDRPLQGFVSADLQVAIHCQFVADEWHPLFGIKRGQGRFELPSCFKLSDECIEALEIAVNDHKETA